MTVEAEPDHVAETIQNLADMHHALDEATTPIQRVANRVTGVLGRPGFVALVLGLIVLWVIGNFAAVRLGVSAIDRFPFPDLALLATVSAVVLALIILSTQRHEDEIAKQRARLTLQIALLSEKKIAKIIALLEEQRDESPLLASRTDKEAEAMATAADPEATLRHIEAIHRE